ncbi:MAG: 4-alpha-glucanotransferase [Candidatus Poseidoniaceae archaeon]|nr:MAG: 4-alpha-glucanotransferase [Candidatus Poseidoniaceae archaeon]
MKGGHQSGILCHLTSLPSQKLSEGHRFVDWLRENGFSYWQMLPLTPPDKYSSPYASPSAFAGWGDLTDSEQNFPMEEDAYWLKDWALFCAIKQDQGGKPWYEWPEPLKNRNPEALAQFDPLLEPYILQQQAFAAEWNALRKHANNSDVKMIGDVPIFIAHDSADVWAHRELFQLDESGYPTYIAGVPPDYFSETGQVWETVLYNWEAHEDESWRWWEERMKRMFRMYDIVRIDHFRGFHSNWAIPYPEDVATNGHWQKGPEDKLFNHLMTLVSSPDQIIAEDLGIIPREVIEFRQRHKLRGMGVLQFGFSDDINTNPHHPYNIREDQIVYTGTHDNNTAEGWFASASDDERQQVRSLAQPQETVSQTLIRLAKSTESPISIIPLQDCLGLGEEARMNIPGQKGKNWAWKFTWQDLVR